MPTPENIKLTVTVNSDPPVTGPVTGGVAVTDDDVIQLGIDNSSGVRQYRYEIYGWPPSFTLPAGWTLGSDGRTFYFAGPIPPTFVIPSNAAVWGNWTLRLIVNNGKRTDPNNPNQQVAANDLIDDSIILVKPSPSGVLEDVGFGENRQVDPLELWIGAIRRNIRALEGQAFAGGGEANLIGSVGAGASLAKGKSGVTLQVRSITEGDLIIVTENVNDVNVAVDLTALQALIDAVDSGDPSAIMFPYTFDDPTADADPGTARFRLDNATIANATNLYIDLVDGVNRTLTDFFDDIDTGSVWIVKQGTPTMWAAYSITSRTTATGYRKFAITHVAGPGGFDDEDGCRLFFTKQVSNDGIVGDTFKYTYSDTTTKADPGNGLVRFDSTDLTAVVAAYIDSSSMDVADLDSFLLLLTSGTLTVEKDGDRDVRHTFDITGVTDETGYVELTLEWQAGDGTPIDGDIVWLQFVRTALSDTVPVYATTEETIQGTIDDEAVTPNGLAALWERNATAITGAGNLTLGEGGVFELTTSTAAVTGFTYTVSKIGRQALIIVSTVRELTYNVTSFILPGAANITTQVGDTFRVLDLGSGNIKVIDYTRADGTAVVGSDDGLSILSMSPVSTGTYTSTFDASWDLAALVPANCVVKCTVHWCVGKDSGDTSDAVPDMIAEQRLLATYNGGALLQVQHLRRWLTPVYDTVDGPWEDASIQYSVVSAIRFSNNASDPLPNSQGFLTADATGGVVHSYCETVEQAGMKATAKLVIDLVHTRGAQLTA